MRSNNPTTMNRLQDMACLRWYVAQTRARQELLASKNLEAQNFEVFLPQILKTTRHARKHRNIKVAVFPGYIFIRLNPHQHRWRSVNGTIGVTRLLTVNDRPAAAPIGVVESLMSCVDSSGYCQVEKDLGVGQSVRIIKGPLSCLMAEILSMDGKGRARVLLELMGGKVVTLLERTSLEVAA